MPEELPDNPVAIRRWGDACFHAIDEVVEEGYILHGHLISHDDVVEVRRIENGETCPRRPVVELKPPRQS